MDKLGNIENKESPLSNLAYKVNNTETSRGELTKIRDQLKDMLDPLFESQEKNSQEKKEIENLLDFVQVRISNEEPNEIRTLRLELDNLKEGDMSKLSIKFLLEKGEYGEILDLYQARLEKDIKARGINSIKELIEAKGITGSMYKKASNVWDSDIIGMLRKKSMYNSLMDYYSISETDANGLINFIVDTVSYSDKEPEKRVACFELLSEIYMHEKINGIDNADLKDKVELYYKQQNWKYGNLDIGLAILNDYKVRKLDLPYYGEIQESIMQIGDESNLQRIMDHIEYKREKYGMDWIHSEYSYEREGKNLSDEER